MVRKLIVLAVALSVAAPGVAQAPAATLTLQPNETLLEVDASGEAKGTPDEAGLSAELEVDGATPDQALAALNARAAKLADAARGAGVPDRSIHVTGLTVSRKFKLDKDGDETDQVIGYTASSRFELNHLTIPVASAAINALAGAGVTRLSGPDFGFSDADALRRKARADAVAKARAEADDYAAALGMKVARVLRVSERATGGAFEGADIVVTGSRRGAIPPPVLLPGEQTISARVWIDYALVPR